MGVSSAEGPIHSSPTVLPSQDLYVINRPLDSNRKAGTTGTPSHETNPVASQNTLESSRIPGKRDSSPKVSSPALSLVDQRDQCFARSTSAPPTSCHSNLYRHLKRRLGCSLGQLYNKRRLVSTRKPPSHKLPRTKSGLAGLKKVPAPCTREGSADCHRQYHRCGLHQQGGRYGVRLTLCPSLAAPVLVQPEAGCSKGQTHSWSPQCDCRQAITSRPDNPDRMVSSPGGIQPFGSSLAPSPCGHVCNKVQLQVSPIRVPSSGPQCLGSGCSDSQLGEPGHVHVPPPPPVSLLGKVVSKLSDHLFKRVILIAPGWPNMPWFWDLVDLSAQIPLRLPLRDLVTQPFNKACHRDLTNLNLHAWLLEPKQSRSKGSLALWRHKLRLLREVQPGQSMRQSGPYLSDGVKQVRWTSGLHLSNT